MSHFAVLVLVDGGSQMTEDQLDDKVSELLAPYDENSDVPEYERRCSCVGTEAKSAGWKEAEKIDPIDTIRTRYWEARKAWIKQHPELTPSEQDEIGHLDGDALEEFRKTHPDFPDWKTYTQAHSEVSDRVENAHPLFGKPNPDCDTCAGSGIEKTTYNPQSKWDWWVIGGRWTGLLSDYDPADDPENMEPCDLCDQTGKRTWTKAQAMADPFKLGSFKPEEWPEGVNEKVLTCNACQGHGTRLKFPAHWANRGNYLPAKQVDVKKHRTYAVVTPDGAWHARGEMGWFGMSHENKAQEAWEDEFSTWVHQHPNALAVVVDCHI